MMAFLDFSLAVENEGVLCAAIMISAGAKREGISLDQACRQGTETPKGWWMRTDPAPTDSALSVIRLERKREEKNDCLVDAGWTLKQILLLEFNFALADNSLFVVVKGLGRYEPIEWQIK